MPDDDLLTELAELRAQFDQLKATCDSAEANLQRLDDMIADVAESLPETEE